MMKVVKTWATRSKPGRPPGAYTKSPQRSVNGVALDARRVRFGMLTRHGIVDYVNLKHGILISTRDARILVESGSVKSVKFSRNDLVSHAEIDAFFSKFQSET